MSLYFVGSLFSITNPVIGFIIFSCDAPLSATNGINPLAIASKMTFPNVSVVLGNTK